MMIFLQKYFLKGFLKNGCIWTKFREALCDMDKKIKKSMKMTIFYDAITCTYADPLLANKLPLRSIFLKFINLLKNFNLERRILEPCHIKDGQRTQRIQNPVKHPRAVNYFRKKPYVRRTNGF